MVDLLKNWNPNKYMVEVENDDGLLDKLSKSKTGEVIIDDKGKEDTDMRDYSYTGWGLHVQQIT